MVMVSSSENLVGCGCLGLRHGMDGFDTLLFQQVCLVFN